MSIATKESNPKILNTRVGNVIAEQKSWPEADAQSFVNGSLVYLDAGGRVTECGANPTLIYGRALADATGVLDSEIPVEQWSGRDEITIQCSDGSDPITSDNVVPGTQYAIKKISNVWYVDNSDTVTNPRLVIVNRDVDPEDYESNDTWCRARVIDDYIQTEGSR